MWKAIPRNLCWSTARATRCDFTYENALSQHVALPIHRAHRSRQRRLPGFEHRLLASAGSASIRGNRPYYPKNQIVYSYSGRTRASIMHQSANQPRRHLRASSAGMPIDDARRTMSLWGGLEAPTGSVAKLTGDGAWDGALWAARRRAAGRRGSSRRNSEWRNPSAMKYLPAIGAPDFACSRGSRPPARWEPAWSLRAQLDGQTGRVAGQRPALSRTQLCS